MLGPLMLYMLFLIFIFPIYYIFFWRKNMYYHSSWNALIDDFSFSSKQFYTLIRQELKKKGIEGVKFDEVKLRKGNIFSSRRLYLRIHYRDFHFDMCAAPFGKGFFLSWWHMYKFSFWEWFIVLIPFIGNWLYKKLFTLTYYKMDTATMFMKYTHLCVLNVLDELTISEGVRLLEDDERKPILNDIFKR